MSDRFTGIMFERSAPDPLQQWHQERAKRQMDKYSERFGLAQPDPKPEPQVELRYVMEPKPADTRTPEDILEDAELAVMVARYNVEHAKESGS